MKFFWLQNGLARKKNNNNSQNELVKKTRGRHHTQSDNKNSFTVSGKSQSFCSLKVHTLFLTVIYLVYPEVSVNAEKEEKNSNHKR